MTTIPPPLSSVTNPDQIRTVLEAYKRAVYGELSPDREKNWAFIPKTLIFAPVAGGEVGESGARVAALTRPGAAARVAAACLGEARAAD